MYNLSETLTANIILASDEVKSAIQRKKYHNQIKQLHYNLKRRRGGGGYRKNIESYTIFSRESRTKLDKERICINTEAAVHWCPGRPIKWGIDNSQTGTSQKQMSMG